MTTATRFSFLAALALTAGCNVVVPVDLDLEVPLDGPGGGAVGVVSMNLADQQQVWSQRGQIQELRVETVELDVVAIGERNEAEEARLVIGYRPEGAPQDGSCDIRLLEVDAFRIAPGERTVLDSAPNLSAALQATLAGDGRFGLVATLEARQPVDALLQLSIHGSAVVGVGGR